MSTIIFLLIALAIFETSLYGLLFLTQKLFKDYSANWYYQIVKKVLLFCLLPSIIISIIIMYKSIEFIRIDLNQPDFEFMEVSNGMITPAFYNNNENIVLPILFFVWLSIVIIKSIYTIYVNVNCYKMIQASVRELDHDNLQSINPRLLKELEHKVEIRCSKIVQIPMLLNIGRPVIILPEYSFTQEELNLIIAHELAHFRNKDIMIYRLVLCLQTIHFFNPITNMFINHVIDTSELACDELVLANASKNTRITYAKLIVKILKNSTGEPSKLLMNTLVRGGTVANLKRRLLKIMIKKNRKGKALSMMILSIAYSILCPFVIFASTSISMMAANTYTKFTMEKNSTYTESDILEEFVQPLSNYVFPELNLKDLNKIDFNLASGKEARIKVTSTTDNIRVSLFSDNENETFNVGIGIGNKIHYVSSQDGMVSHSFSDLTDGTYYIYIKNTSSKTIHITGQIYV